jgi:hypothetical protein
MQSNGQMIFFRELKNKAMETINVRDNGSLSYKLGAWSCVILVVYTLATILVVVLIGGPPQSVEECFNMLRENRMNGLLRLDILTMFVMPFYYVLFYALYTALKNTNYTLARISAIFIFAGVTIFLSAPSVFSYLRLSDGYWQAPSDDVRNLFKAAAESVLASDIWNGTGARISGLLVQTGAVILSVLMLRSSSFTKLTSYTGILTHGLDLLHIIFAFFMPALANGIMGVAGVLYLLWFPLITVGLFRLSKSTQQPI